MTDDITGKPVPITAIKVEKMDRRTVQFERMARSVEEKFRLQAGLLRTAAFDTQKAREGIGTALSNIDRIRAAVREFDSGISGDGEETRAHKERIIKFLAQTEAANTTLNAISEVLAGLPEIAQHALEGMRTAMIARMDSAFVDNIVDLSGLTGVPPSWELLASFEQTTGAGEIAQRQSPARELTLVPGGSAPDTALGLGAQAALGEAREGAFGNGEPTVTGDALFRTAPGNRGEEDAAVAAIRTSGDSAIQSGQIIHNEDRTVIDGPIPNDRDEPSLQSGVHLIGIPKDKCGQILSQYKEQISNPQTERREINKLMVHLEVTAAQNGEAGLASLDLLKEFVIASAKPMEKLSAHEAQNALRAIEAFDRVFSGQGVKEEITSKILEIWEQIHMQNGNDFQHLGLIKKVHGFMVKYGLIEGSN